MDQVQRQRTSRPQLVFRAEPTRRELTVTFVGVHGEIFERTYDA